MPDILVADSPSPAIALKSVAPTLPIVCLTLTDAGIPDLFASYARPGGNVTGVFLDFPDFSAKCLQLLTEAVPASLRSECCGIGPPVSCSSMRSRVRPKASASACTFPF